MENKSKVRKAILDAAEKLFSQYGYEKTSVDQITKLANRAKTSLYYHFDSKLSIFKNCLEKEFQTLKESMADIREQYGENNAQCLAEYLRVRIEMLPQMPVYRSYVNSVTLNQTGGDLKDAVDSVRKDFDKFEYRYFYDTAQRGREDGVFPDKVSPDAFAKMLIVILHGLEIQFYMSKDLRTLRSTYESLIEVLLQRHAVARPQN
ncbi:MAG: TetR/AcrR family transcriptional regulator [Bacteroidales bacterium]|nr:TetR/AcrR family transcriptional regulator [Bacteroidales bacterium]